MSNLYNDMLLEQLFEEGLELYNGDRDKAAAYAEKRFEQMPEPDIKEMQDGGGVFGAFDAPPASTEMFKKLQDRTNIFDDPMGSKALGAVNRAIVGAPIDAIDFLGRVGETGLRAAATGAGGIMSAITGDEGKGDQFKRDIYGLGIAAGTAAGAAPRVAPPIKSSRATKGDNSPNPTGDVSASALLEVDAFSKAKSPAKKEAHLTNYENAAITDAIDATVDMRNNPRGEYFAQVVNDIYNGERQLLADGKTLGRHGEGRSQRESLMNAIKEASETLDYVDFDIDVIMRKLGNDYGFTDMKVD